MRTCQCGASVSGKPPAKYCDPCKKLSFRASQKAYRERNREAISEWKRSYNFEYRQRDLEKAKARCAAWAAANPDKVRELGRKKNSRRRALLASSNSPGVSTEQWRSICETHGFRCAYCGVEDKLTVDHVIPISRGGPDAPENVVPACKSCNSSKGAKTLDEWQRTAA